MSDGSCALERHDDLDTERANSGGQVHERFSKSIGSVTVGDVARVEPGTTILAINCNR